MSKTKHGARREAQPTPTPKKEESKNTVILTAKENTFLADGKFIAKDTKVEVSAEYAKRLKQEQSKNFK